MLQSSFEIVLQKERAKRPNIPQEAWWTKQIKMPPWIGYLLFFLPPIAIGLYQMVTFDYSAAGTGRMIHDHIAIFSISFVLSFIGEIVLILFLPFFP